MPRTMHNAIVHVKKGKVGLHERRSKIERQTSATSEESAALQRVGGFSAGGRDGGLCPLRNELPDRNRAAGSAVSVVRDDAGTDRPCRGPTRHRHGDRCEASGTRRRGPSGRRNNAEKDRAGAGLAGGGRHKACFHPVAAAARRRNGGNVSGRCCGYERASGSDPLRSRHRTHRRVRGDISYGTCRVFERGGPRRRVALLLRPPAGTKAFSTALQQGRVDHTVRAAARETTTTTGRRFVSGEEPASRNR